MVCEALTQTGLHSYNNNFGLKQLLKSVITKAQEYEVSLKLKVNVCIAMRSLVTSLTWHLIVSMK